MAPGLLVDTSAVFAFQQFLRAHDYPVQGNIDYGALLSSLSQRTVREFDPMFAFVAVNPEHEGQRKFIHFLAQKGFIVDETDFRDAFILPNRESQYQRLSTRVTYLAGMLATKRSDLIVVTDAFEVHGPLADYAENRGGKVTLAFFRRGMEERWQRTGIFEGESLIEFIDLSPDARRIIGVDLGSSVRTGSSRSGLAGFQI
jgi:hypothetical protein